jgi:DnaD/phage-associated family protein
MCWIKLYRKFVEWEWYSDVNCKVVFLHLLLTANWQPKRWQGRVIDVGEVVVGRESLAEAVGISVQQVRTALKKLVESDVIEVDTTNKFTVIKIKNYEKYQENSKNQPTNNQLETQTRESIEGVGGLEVNQQITNNQPTNNQQITTPKELKKDRIKEYKNIDGGAYNIYNNYNIGDAPPPPEKEVPSSEVGEVFRVYEQNIGVLSPIIVDILKDRITAQGAALVSLAVAEAVKNGAKSIRYIERVLKAWEDDNITTVESAKLRIAERQNKSQKRSDGALPSNVEKSKFRNYPKNANEIGEIELQKIKEMMNL